MRGKSHGGHCVRGVRRLGNRPAALLTNADLYADHLILCAFNYVFTLLCLYLVMHVFTT